MPYIPKVQLAQNGYTPVLIEGTSKRFRDNFGYVGVDPDRWQQSVVNGGTITASGNSQLVLATGTAINSVSRVISVPQFQIPMRLCFQIALSQRIAGQEFDVELVAVDPRTGVLDETQRIGVRFNGVTATSQLVVARNGTAAEVTSAITTGSTASAINLEMEFGNDECTILSRLFDTAGSPRTPLRTNHTLIPDPSLTYVIRISARNTTATSNTTLTVTLVSASDYTELPVEVVGGRGNASWGNAIPVQVQNEVSFRTGLNSFTLNSAATTNATSVRASPASMTSLMISNHGAAARFVKLYSLSVAPTVGTSIPTITIPVPAGGFVSVDCGVYGFRFTTGIGLAITAGAPDADVAAVGAGEVKVQMIFV
jgi:hypothetical protein